MLHRLLGLALLLPLLLLSACDSDGSDGETPRVGLSGRWVGDLVYTQDASQVFPVDLTMTDDTRVIVGSGVVQLPTEALQFDIVSGQYSGNFVNLELIFDRPPQGSLSGNVNADRDLITGTMGGPGLVNGTVELALRRAN